MRASKIAWVAALLGGLCWVGHVGLVAVLGGDMSLGGPVAISFYLGVGLLGIALLAGGYTTVATAPIWLRVVVSLAALALGLIVGGSINSAAKSTYQGDDWLHDVLGILVCAGLALIASWIGYARDRSVRPTPPPRGGHRAAR